MAGIHVLGSSIFLYVFLLMIPATCSVSESEALLKLKNSFGNPAALVSWNPGTEPCAARNSLWIGVKCDDGVITGLSLGHLGLSGKIDVEALGSLSGLRSVSFLSNAFSGPIPDFSPLGNLRGLHLSMNRFSGEIPDGYFNKMGALRKVWLTGNAFSGPIPSSLARLSHLVELHLENNKFSGAIPPFEQRGLVAFNLSFNDLEGEIPLDLSRFGPNAFLGNPKLCGENVTTACEKPPLKLDSLQMKIFVWAVLASLIVLFALMILGIYVLKRKQDRNLDLMNDLEPSVSASNNGKQIIESGQQGFGSSHRGGSSHKGSGKFGKGDIVMMNEDKGVFGLSDLMRAAAEVIGNGAVGSSYKATMISGLTVVVKRVKGIGKMGKDQFDSEMRKIGALKHKNLLTPLAYHYRKDEKLLVHEYQPKGSLLFVLHVDRGISHAQLNWPARLKIIQGIARGLAHLHAQLPSLDLPHGNLKSSNVLLSEDYEPQLSDFGLNSLITPGHASKTLTAYKSPEAVLQNQVSSKSDVYCLGIVILEIMTGKFPNQYLNNTEGGTDVVQWVRLSIVEGKGSDIFDPDMVRDKDCVGEMEKMLRIGADCTEGDPGTRLDLAEAVRRVEAVKKDGDGRDTRTVRFRTASGNLYGSDTQDASSASFREKA